MTGPADEPAIDVTRAATLTPRHGRVAPGPVGPGRAFGPYRIDALIAHGGNAHVYRATDQLLARPVALKVLDAADSGDARERFLREVQVIAGLTHPHIVGLYAAGDEDGVAYAAMELLHGTVADQLASRGRIPWDESLRIAREACLGLEAAAAKGIVHRDVKPSNLLRDAEGRIKVGDFGLAKDLSSTLELTLHGVVLGTPLYVSPEQGCGRAADLRSDLYSLGASLFHMIEGRPPFHAPTPFELIVRHAVEPAPSLSDGVPPHVSALVKRLLEKDPANRPQTYAAAIAAIDQALAAGCEPTPTTTARPRGGDALAISQLAAARGALDLGRAARAKDMLDRLFRERTSVWADAGLDLAAVLERAGDLASARSVLEPIAAEGPDANVRALALWTLGSLAEKESDAALQRAIDIYARVLEVSGTLFPKTLLDARINKLQNKVRGRAE